MNLIHSCALFLEACQESHIEHVSCITDHSPFSSALDVTCPRLQTIFYWKRLRNGNNIFCIMQYKGLVMNLVMWRTILSHHAFRRIYGNNNILKISHENSLRFVRWYFLRPWSVLLSKSHIRFSFILISRAKLQQKVEILMLKEWSQLTFHSFEGN